MKQFKHPNRLPWIIPRCWKTIRKQLPNYLFILPHYIFFVAFILYPIARGLYISLFDWKIMGKTQHFIGFANYQALSKDQIFWESLGNTVQFMLLQSPLIWYWHFSLHQP